MEKKRVQLSNGTTIAYVERPGPGESLILLHGITDNSLTYAPLLDAIDPGCHVYALDLRGHGDSDKPESLYSTEGYADDIRCFIQEVLGGAPVLLEGHSLGGLVAVQVAVTAPTLVQSLFLEDPPLYFVGNLDEVYEAAFNAMVLIARTLQDGSRSRDDWFKVMADAPDPYSGKPGIETMGETKINLRLDSLGMMKPKALEDGLAGSLEWDTDKILAGVQCPVVMMTGSTTVGAVISEDESAKVSEILPDCRVINMKEVGHLVHDEQPGAWLESLNQWIGTSR